MSMSVFQRSCLETSSEGKISVDGQRQRWIDVVERDLEGLSHVAGGQNPFWILEPNIDWLMSGLSIFIVISLIVPKINRNC